MKYWAIHRKVERVMGIEPTLEAWEAAVLPLNYTRETKLLSDACIIASDLLNKRQRLQSCSMEITLNGQPKTFSGVHTVAELVESLGYQGKRIAIERNGEIVPKSTYADTPVAPGDQFEIVVAVGGG